MKTSNPTHTANTDTSGNPKGSNVSSTRLPRRQFGRGFKILVAEEYLSTKGATYKAVAARHQVGVMSVRLWCKQYTTGLLDDSNAVAFSTRPVANHTKKDALVNLRRS